MAVGSFIDSFLNDCDIIEDTEKTQKLELLKLRPFLPENKQTKFKNKFMIIEVGLIHTSEVNLL